MGSFQSSARPLASSIDGLTDEEILELIEAARKDPSTDVGITDEHTSWSGRSPAHRIAPDAVVKKASAHEAYITTYVASRSSQIHLPKVRRLIPLKRVDSYRLVRYWLVMDFVDGDILETAWPRMSWWRRLCTVWKLRRSLKELHRIPLPRRDSGAGPFESYRAMSDFYDHLRYCCLVIIHHYRGTFEPHLIPTFDASQSLVLCHNDLNMRNIMVNQRGEVWLVDWGMAGAFPPWFEYANLMLFARAAIPKRRLPKTWTFFARFIAGNYRWYDEKYLFRLDPAFSGLFSPSLDTEDYFEKLGLSIEYCPHLSALSETSQPV
ncbi:kinase-like domain-containing protein [Abortiporus biennis]|nr:kinase-like domain-containing protein [Abortiporus biennis]